MSDNDTNSAPERAISKECITEKKFKKQVDNPDRKKIKVNELLENTAKTQGNAHDTTGDTPEELSFNILSELFNSNGMELPKKLNQKQLKKALQQKALDAITRFVYNQKRLPVRYVKPEEGAPIIKNSPHSYLNHDYEEEIGKLMEILPKKLVDEAIILGLKLRTDELVSKLEEYNKETSILKQIFSSLPEELLVISDEKTSGTKP